METDKSDYSRTRFQYYRIPSKYGTPNKGKPDSRVLHLYERGKGFKEQTLIPYNVPNSKGGMVICELLMKNEDGTYDMVFGVADCSYADNFCYKIGREIALGRAKKQLEKRRNK